MMGPYESGRVTRDQHPIPVARGQDHFPPRGAAAWSKDVIPDVDGDIPCIITYHMS